MIRPRLELECARCHERPPRDVPLEVLALHFTVEHDTDDVELALIAVCTCAATMTFVESCPTGGGWHDYFRCDACGETGRVKRNARP